jgi:hypothetical protein
LFEIKNIGYTLATLFRLLKFRRQLFYFFSRRACCNGLHLNCSHQVKGAVKVYQLFYCFQLCLQG